MYDMCAMHIKNVGQMKSVMPNAEYYRNARSTQDGIEVITEEF